MKLSGLTRSTAWYTIGNLFVRSSNFILLPFYSNFISPGEYGNYALLISFYAVSMVFYQGGYQTALARFYLKEDDPQKRNSIFSTISIFAILAAFIFSIIIILAADNFSDLIFSTGQYSDLIILLAGAMFFETAGSQFINLLIIIEKASKVVIVSAAGALVNFILNIIFIYSLGMGITGIIAAQVISAAGVLIFLSPVIFKNILIRIDPDLIKRVLLFTLPLVAGGILSIGVDVADRFILNHFLGRNDVGIYSFSYRIALIMNLFVISFRTAWMPYSLKLYNSNNYKNVFGGTLLKYLSASGAIFISASLLTGDLFDINISGFNLFESHYAGGLIILPYILAGYLLSGISSFYSVYPFISDKTYHFVIADGLAFIFNIILNFILIPQYGLIGAAFSTMVSFGAGAGYLIMISLGKIVFSYPARRIILLVSLILTFTIAGLLLNNILTDIVIIGIFLFLLLIVLKINPLGILPEKRINKVDELD